MPRGVSQDLLDHPVVKTCWCGTQFQKKAHNQEHCCRRHRDLASILRGAMRLLPPPAVPQRKRELPDLDSKKT